MTERLQLFEVTLPVPVWTATIGLIGASIAGAAVLISQYVGRKNLRLQMERDEKHFQLQIAKDERQFQAQMTKDETQFKLEMARVEKHFSYRSTETTGRVSRMRGSQPTKPFMRGPVSGHRSWRSKASRRRCPFVTTTSGFS